MHAWYTNIVETMIIMHMVQIRIFLQLLGIPKSIPNNVTMRCVFLEEIPHTSWHIINHAFIKFCDKYTMMWFDAGS
jgi:hypothetical protein